MKYPEMRQELLIAIKVLSDLEYQKQNWLANKNGKNDCFDNVIHFLYDHADFMEEPEETIDLFVKDERELKAILKVMESLEELFNLLGTNASDLDYVNSQKWIDVVTSAKDAIQILKQ